MEHEVDPILEGLTEQQLKDLIVNNVREITRLKEDAKAYAKAARETIKSFNNRNTDALELIELNRAERGV